MDLIFVFIHAKTEYARKAVLSNLQPMVTAKLKLYFMDADQLHPRGEISYTDQQDCILSIFSFTCPCIEQFGKVLKNVSRNNLTTNKITVFNQFIAGLLGKKNGVRRKLCL
jgi:hypothetical protein